MANSTAGGPSPVIIIGMHRSGTTMVARMLDGIGLFTGQRKEGNRESIFFLRLNNWLLRQAGASWDNPEPIKYLLDNEELCEMARDFVAFYLNSPRLISYLGWGRYLKYRTLGELDFPWGWKDPRNTFTLPLWLMLFPNAKVIHIYRHGVDVAASLQRRDKELSAERRHRLPLLNIARAVSLNRARMVLSARCLQLEEAFNLWEIYMGEAKLHISKIGPRGIEIKYEDFVSAPNDHLLELAKFCGIDPSKKLLCSANEGVRASRAYAFREQSQLQQFAEKVSPRLALMGY